MRTEFLCISVLRVASVPRMKLAGCKVAFVALLTAYNSRYEYCFLSNGITFFKTI